MSALLKKPAEKQPDNAGKNPPEGLSHVVEVYLEEYFKAHEGTAPSCGLYHMILNEVEAPLLLTTLKAVGGNQKKAAAILGINRNTLKRKLDQLKIPFLDK